MTPVRWQRVKQVLEGAFECEAAERRAFVDRVCAGDAELRSQVEALLAADEDTGEFLAAPAIGSSSTGALATVPDTDAAGLIQAAVIGAIEELPEQESSDLAGTRVGRYTISGLIGKGGMGAVYRAVREDDFQMVVAIKLLKRGTDTDAALSRFRAERQILAALQHPNIARLLDGGATDTGLPYLVMEYVEGTPLLEHARPLSIRKRLELFRSVCAAVQYAHQNLIVHRDIKPANILVTPDGIAKLLDFGIAKLLDPAGNGEMTALTAVGGRLMTPDYASPEQVRGEPVTTATDVYSLGAVLYELLTGERAQHVDRYSPEAVQAEICKREPKKPSLINRTLDTDLDNITLMALRKEPQRRYASAEQFSDDIQLYLQGRPVRARKDTLRYRSGKFLRRNKAGVAIAALGAIALGTGVAAVDRQARRAEHRFQQVRSLANTVLFDLNREIETLTGSTKARELLVKTSLQYLDSLAAEAGNDPALQMELAAAYEKTGDVLGNPLFSNLGRPQESLESYRKSLAIAERLAPSHPVMEVLARSRYKIGCVYSFALGRVREGRENMQAAVRVADSIPQVTGQPSWRVRADAHGFLGDMDTYVDPAAAAAPLRRALEISRQWAAAVRDSESQYFVAIAMSRLGIASQETGDLAGALDLLLGSLRLLEQLLTQEPQNAVWRRESHALYDRLGWVTGHPQYFNLGDHKAAAGWVRKLWIPSRGVSDAEQLAAVDPANIRAQFELSEAMAAYAAITREANPSGAEQIYRRSLALNTTVLSSNPEDANTVYWQAFNRVGFAWVLEKLGKRGEALTQLNVAVERMEILDGKHPGDARFREYLGLALHTRAATRLRGGDGAGAAQDLERALGILEPLYRENPRNLTHLRDLADCYQGFGNLHASRRDWKLAHESYRKSLDLWGRWKGVGTSSVYDRERRAVVARLVGAAEENLQRTFALR